MQRVLLTSFGSTAWLIILVLFQVFKWAAAHLRFACLNQTLEEEADFLLWIFNVYRSLLPEQATKSFVFITQLLLTLFS